MKMFKLFGSALILGLALPSATPASTPAAWAELDRRVVRACIAMSGLSQPQVLARKISYSDAIGIEVRMIRGTAKGRMQRKLCAYHRRTGRTEIQDAGGWLGSTTRP